MDRGVSTLEVALPADVAGWRFDRALAAAIPDISRERLKVLISAGNVARADGTLLRDPSAKTVLGDVIVSVPLPIPDKAEAQDIALNVLFEDDYLLIVDKPAGLVVHPAAGNLDGTLVNALLHHCAGRLSGIGGVARPGIVHRIDKDTSGLLVVAKTDKAHEGLAKQFAAHTIDRRYLAIANGLPGNGTVDAPLARSPHDRKKVAIIQSGKRAVTHYRTLTPLRGAALVECQLETGRTHQIRVHMASIGHSLIGDQVYGKPRSGQAGVKQLNFRRQALHATRLGFIHPGTSQTIAFDSPMPMDMQELFTALRV
jgi:23S rRNA pseudouridine1911/1915/1917 synthase